MIRMEYPSVNLDDYSGDAKVYALQSQVNSLANALQIVLDSLEDDGNVLTQGIDEVSGKTSELKELTDRESAELRTLIDSKVSASTSTGSGTKANMASSTNLSNLAELTLPDKGVYILVGLARFASNANGRRGLCWGVSATGYYDHALVVVPPVNGAITRIQSVALCTATSENYKVYLNAYHTAGTSLNVDYYWRYIKLA